MDWCDIHRLMALREGGWSASAGKKGNGQLIDGDVRTHPERD